MTSLHAVPSARRGGMIDHKAQKHKRAGREHRRVQEEPSRASDYFLRTDEGGVPGKIEAMASWRADRPDRRAIARPRVEHLPRHRRRL